MANVVNVSFKERLSRTFKKWHKKPIGVKAFLIVFFLFFLFQAIIQMIPFFLLLNDSLKSFTDYSENGSLALNTSWAFDNYARVFKEFKVKGDISKCTKLLLVETLNNDTSFEISVFLHSFWNGKSYCLRVSEYRLKSE